LWPHKNEADQRDKLAHLNKYTLRDIQIYRLFEILVMYSQIFGIIFYILYGKIMKKVIKWAGRRDEEDPWQIILWNRNQDFLENDNFFMSICVI